MPLLMADGKFAVTPMHGSPRAAGLVEFGGLEAPASKAPFDYLEREVRRAFPMVTWDRTEQWMGHRPATSDSIPVIGNVEGHRGLFAGFGHHHIGLTGGPKTGKLLAQLVDAQLPNIKIQTYSPTRHW